MNLRTLGAVVAALCAATIDLACTAGGAASPPAAAPGAVAAPPVPVTITTVLKKSMPLEIRVIGTAAAYSTVEIRPQVAGQLTSVAFNEGEEVAQGQTLFTLDQRPLETALEAAEANLARDTAQADNVRAQATRYQDLARRGIATLEQVDQMTSTAAALEATNRADRASIANARLQLQYATIAAPISGRTGALIVHPGNLVQPGQTTPLVVINQVSPIYIAFAIPEAQLADVKRYMALGSLKVEAELPNDSGRRSDGRLTFLDNTVDETTGTIKLKGTFPNQDRRFWPGQFVNVVLTLTTIPDAAVVSTQAIQTGQTGSYVFRVKADQTVEVEPVAIAVKTDTETVIKDGLTPGDVVIETGQLRLIPGSRISVKSGDPASPK